MAPSLVKKIISTLINKGQIPEDYREHAEVELDRELRRNVRAYCSRLARRTGELLFMDHIGPLSEQVHGHPNSLPAGSGNRS